jgi:hypothetical protein
VIEGPVDLAAFARAWQPLTVRLGADILRANQIFVENDARALLIDALTIEAGRKQPFYVLISRHEKTTTVRLDPMTHPERSDAVRALVAEVAARLLAATPGGRIDTTNLVLPSGKDRGDTR